MIRNIFYILLLCLPLASAGQLLEPLKGGEYSTARKENFNGFLGENQTTLFTVDYLYLSRKKQELIVRKFYKSDLKLVDSKNIYTVPPDGFYGEPTDVYYSRDTLFLFCTVYDETKKINLITLETFDVNGIKISEFTVDTLDEDENLVIKPELDSAGFMIIRSNKFSNLTEQEIGCTYVLRSGEVLWRKEVKSPMALQNVTIEGVIYRQNFPLYILCNYNFEAERGSLDDEKNLINNKYALWAYDLSSNFLKEFEIRLKGKWMNGVKMEMNPLNQLVLSGYYNESRYNTIVGTFSLLINSDLSIAQSNYTKWNEDVLFKFIDEKDRSKTKELEDYRLNDMIMLENGSYFLLGERYYKYIERTYDPRTNITTTTEHYNYNSIVVTYVDSLGKPVWTDRVPKYQNSTNDFGYFSSFAWMKTGSEVYLFFNDSEKNNDLALNDYFNYKGLFNNRRFQITYVQIDTSGLVKRGPLVGTDNPFMLRAKESNAISSTTMYLFTEVGREAKVFSVGVKPKN